LERLGVGSLTGVRLRGDLAEKLILETRPHFALIAFIELHHAGHHLWHNVDPQSRVYDKAALRDVRRTEPTLSDVYRAADTQVGRLVRAVGESASVLVFSLHGMRPGHGTPAFLPALLNEWGVSRVAGWRSQSWRGRAASVLAVVKRNAPAPVKRLYYRHVPPTTTQRVAQANVLPAYDWSKTRAFSLPSDQHGWVRINMRGREAKGIVPMEEYGQTRAMLAERLRSIRTAAGVPLVREVLCTAQKQDEVLGLRLPDLIIHWTDEVFAAPARLENSAVDTSLLGTKFTGQHSLEGFCIVREGTGGGRAEVALQAEGDSIDSRDLSRLIKRLLAVGPNTDYRFQRR